MIIYEINAVVRADLIERYENYMRGRHIPDLLATGFFTAATFARREANQYQIRYEAADQKSLDEYLENAAPDLREDFLRHFPEGIELSRLIWTVLEDWTI